MRMFDIDETKRLMSRYKLPFCKSALVKSQKDCVRAARLTGWPVVLKIVSPDIIHKSDVGGVITGIGDEKQLVDAYDRVIKTVRKKMPKAKIKGVLVQQMCSGQEVIIGVKRDAQFGHVVMFGLGGVIVEILKDVSFRICPVDKRQAGEMIKEIKGYPLLSGARGKTPVNVDALAGIITQVSKIAIANRKISELDFNPVIAGRKKAVIADARVML